KAASTPRPKREPAQLAALTLLRSTTEDGHPQSTAASDSSSLESARSCRPPIRVTRATVWAETERGPLRAIGALTPPYRHSSDHARSHPPHRSMHNETFIG